MKLNELIRDLRSEMADLLCTDQVSRDFSRLEEFTEHLSNLSYGSSAVSSLKDSLLKLIHAGPEESAGEFLTANSMVQKISVSLFSFSGKEKSTPCSCELPEFKYKHVKYSQVKHLKEALQSGSSSRLNLIYSALANGTCKAIQLLPCFVDSVEDRHAETADLVLEEVLPLFGRNAVPLIRKKLNLKWQQGQVRYISFLFNYQSQEENQQLTSRILKCGHIELKKYILREALPENFNKYDLEAMLNSRSVEVQDLAAKVFEKYT